jgi:methylphosphotriester-DNA--protein-cysteine methyltransferase
VVCRPSCSSRRPNRENVELFATTEAAIARGYRACKRCRPGERHETPVLRSAPGETSMRGLLA